MLRSGSYRHTRFVAGNDIGANRVACDLADQMGSDPLCAGPLIVSRYLEAMSRLHIELALQQRHGTRIGYIYDLNEKPAF